jgi:putative inorganic carbon (HCO3(-)) transporter
VTGRLHDARADAVAQPAAVLAVVLTALAWTLLAYQLGVPLAATLLVAGAAAAVIVAQPVAGVCIAVLAVPLEFAAAEFGGSFGITASEGILLFTAAIAAPRLLLRLSLHRVPAALYAFAGLVLVSGLGVLFAMDTAVVVRITLMWMTFGIVALLVADSPRSHLRAVAVCLGLSAGVLGAMALIGLGDQRAAAGGAIVSNRAQASFAHPTALALYLILTFPMAFALALGASTRLRPLLLVSGTLGLIGLMLTHTRGSIVGAAVALIVLLSWAPFRRLAVAGLLLTLIVAVLNVGSITESQPVSVVSERLETIASLKTRNDDRLEIWSATPDIVAERPLLGAGQGNFPEVSTSFALSDVGGLAFDHAHNLFLNVAVELGIVGLGLLLLFLVLLFRAARRALAERSGPLYPMALAASASLVGVLVNSLTEYPVRQNVVMATTMIVVGLLLACARFSGERAPSPEPRPAARL